MADRSLQKLLPFIEKRFLILSLVVLAIAAFNGFYHLDAERVWDWDESLDGVTAYEMLQNHNFVVSTFEHQAITADYADRTAVWNFKPPLGWWCIILGYGLFGPGVTGLRFYSALSYFLIVLGILWILGRQAGRLPALVAGFMLATTSPMVFIHGARSGDLSLFFSFLAFLFICCLWMAEKRPHYLYGAGFVFSLGFLVYSFASFQLPALALAYLGLTGSHRKFSLKNYFYASLCAVLPIAAWVLWRLCYPDGWGFFKGMVSYDLIRRSTQSLEGHTGGWDYYLSAVAKSDPYWFTFTMVVLVCFLAVIGFNFRGTDRWLALSALGFAVPMALFSIAKTKLGWYTLPTHPPFCMAVGCLVGALLGDRRCQGAAKLLILFLCLLAGLRSQREIYKQVRQPARQASQDLLNDFKKTNYPPGSVLYAQGWEHAPYFVAEVACGLRPAEVKDPSECLGHPGYLMLEKEKKSTAGGDFAADHHLPVVVQNEDWMIVKL